MIGVDLHTHSLFSDGELSPSDLVVLAHQKNIKVLSLTDHDTMDGNAIARDCATKFGIRFIDGVEISSYWQRVSTQRSHSVHIVALDVQNLEPIQQLLLQQKLERAERAKLICAKLSQVLKQDILQDVRAMTDGHDDRITRSHIAQVLVKRKIVSRVQQAFDRYLKQGKPAYVPFMGVSMQDAIDVIHNSGGFAVLAHPTKYDHSATNVRAMIDLFAQYGGDAIELPPQQENASTRQMIDRLIAQHDLYVSIGSDFHGAHMPWLHLGQVPILKQGQRGIWDLFKGHI